MYEALILHY